MGRQLGALEVQAGRSGLAGEWLEALWLEGMQHRLPLGEEPKRERRGRRVAVLESRREDGRYEYRTRKGQVLELTARGLVKRLVALIPPKGVPLTVAAQAGWWLRRLN
jgi:hypothetical protein